MNEEIEFRMSEFKKDMDQAFMDIYKSTPSIQTPEWDDIVARVERGETVHLPGLKNRYDSVDKYPRVDGDKESVDE